MTDEEKIAAINSSLANSLQILKALFSTLFGTGLEELSKDQRIFTQAIKTQESRLVEKNRDAEFFIDEGDRKTGSYTMEEARRKLTGRK